MIKSRVEIMDKKLLIGKYMEMSYIHDRTTELWKSFMPERNQIPNRANNFYYSLQIYPGLFDYASFNPANKFIKWAAVEVINHDLIPSPMEGYILNGGLYGVFTHIGAANTFWRTMKFIHEIWLPESEYSLNDREHFEVLPENYNPLDEQATEEVWIPIVRKI